MTRVNYTESAKRSWEQWFLGQKEANPCMLHNWSQFITRHDQDTKSRLEDPEYGWGYIAELFILAQEVLQDNNR